MGLAPIDRTDLMSNKKAAIAEIVKVRDQLVVMRERLFRLTHEGVGQPEEVVRVGKRPPRLYQLFEEVDRAVVVLELKPLAGLLDQMLSTDVQGSPPTASPTI